MVILPFPTLFICVMWIKQNILEHVYHSDFSGLLYTCVVSVWTDELTSSFESFCGA